MIDPLRSLVVSVFVVLLCGSTIYSRKGTGEGNGMQWFFIGIFTNTFFRALLQLLAGAQ